jgi:membrane protease YdiL (CAAX protease family)
LRDLRHFSLIVLALSWGVGGVYLALGMLVAGLPPLGPYHPLFWFINCAPSLAGFFLAWRRSGAAGVRRLAAGLTRPFAPVWIVVAILFLPLVCAARWPDSGIVFASVPLLFLDIAPWGEEFGWRGFALPRLLEHMTPLAATLVLGTAWIVWHVPAFFVTGIMAVSWDGFFWWALGTMMLSLVMTVLYLRANFSLLVAGIIPHAMINALARAGLWSVAPREVLLLSAFSLVLHGLAGRPVKISFPKPRDLF